MRFMMSKIFWGMVAACTLAFGILLTVHLTDTGVLDFSKEENTETVENTEEESMEVSDGVYELIDATDAKYDGAMQALQAGEEIPVVRDYTKKESVSYNPIYKDDEVASDRNDGKDHFMDDPSESLEVPETWPQEKSNDEYKYQLYKDYVEITEYLGNKSDLVVVEELDGKPVTHIGESTFSACEKLVRVDLPDSIVSIGENAFNGNEELVDVLMPEDLTELGLGAFDGCTHLAKIDIPEGVTEIKDNTFNECESLMKVTGGESVTKIGTAAFNGCSDLQEITLYKGIESIGEQAFMECSSLSKIKLPSTLVTIGMEAFSGCTALETVTIPKNVETVEENSFLGCRSLQELTIKKGVTVIGTGAFSDCIALQEVTFPSTIVSIGTDAFSNCQNLASVSIGKKVKSVKAGAFAGTMIKDVTISGSCSVKQDSFPADCTISYY